MIKKIALYTIIILITILLVANFLTSSQRFKEYLVQEINKKSEYKITNYDDINIYLGHNLNVILKKITIDNNKNNKVNIENIDISTSIFNFFDFNNKIIIDSVIAKNVEIIKNNQKITSDNIAVNNLNILHTENKIILNQVKVKNTDILSDNKLLLNINSIDSIIDVVTNNKNINIDANISNITYDNIKINSIDPVIKIQDNKANITINNIKLYEGNIKLNISSNDINKSKFIVVGNLSNINVENFIKDLSKKEDYLKMKIKGLLNGDINLNLVNSKKYNELIKSISGVVTLNLDKAIISDIDYIKIFGKEKYKTIQSVILANNEGKDYIDFSQFAIDSNINQGQIMTNKIDIKSKNIEASGNGIFHIIEKQIKSKLDIKLTKNIKLINKNINVPLQIYGHISNIKVTYNPEYLLKDIANDPKGFFDNMKNPTNIINNFKNMFGN